MERTGLADSHLHIFDYGSGTDVHFIINEAVASGVTHLVCNGTSERDWESVTELSKKCIAVLPCIGLHPWFIKDRSDNWLTILESLVRENRCGIGEIGLDRLVSSYDSKLQEEVFRSQLELACRYRRPAMIHCVKAWGQLMEILQSKDDLPCGFLLHAYSGSIDLIKPLVKKGAYFSFSGMALIDSYKRAREALSAVPRDRLLIESDSPYMIPPERFRSKTLLSDGKELNHPANLPEILRGISELLAVDTESLQQKLWENSRRFFRPILEI